MRQSFVLTFSTNMSSNFIILFIMFVLYTCICYGIQKCPNNSELKLCGSICEPFCDDPRERLCKIDPTKCTMDCRCLKGLVRNRQTNNCVKVEDCGGNSTTTATINGDSNA